MWSKLKPKKKDRGPYNYDVPTQSESNLAEYNRRKSFDFSDGARPDSMALPPRLFSEKDFARHVTDSRYNITPHTVSPFIEGLSLEPLTAPVMPAAQPEIRLIPPTPPWATPHGSRRGSGAEEEGGSDTEAKGGLHRKALSDDTNSRNNSRSDAARRNKEAALAFEAVGRALQNLQIREASSSTQRAINYSWPLSYQPKTMPPIEPNKAPKPPEQDLPESPFEHDPFEFDD